MKARAARIEATGGPEVIGFVDVDLPPPGAGEITVRNTAVGVNYIDTYHRSGLYKLDLPAGLGSEAAGAVVAVGEGVGAFRVGDRVGVFGPRGGYATAWTVPAAQAVALPDDIADETAAALLLKGATTEFLIERCACVQAGETVLVYAAAGGVGQLLVGWLKAIGATVIAVAGGAEKTGIARDAGADHVIDHKAEDVAARVADITGGKGVPVILDGVGAALWETSLASAARRGRIVSFGNAGGAVTGVALGTLATHGSLFVTRPTMFDYHATPEERERGIARVFAQLRAGAIRPQIGQRFPLEQAADAHRALEASETRGSTLLIPDTATP